MENNFEWNLVSSDELTYHGAKVTLYTYNTQWGTMYTPVADEKKAIYYYNKNLALENKRKTF